MGALKISIGGVWYYAAGADLGPPPVEDTQALILPGTSGSVARVTAGSSLNLPGTQTVYALIRMTDFTPTTIKVLATKWADTGSQRSYAWSIFGTGASGGILAQFTGNGTLTAPSYVEQVTGAPSPAPTDNQWIWIRLHMNAANRLITYSTAVADINDPNTIPTSWTEIASTIAGAAMPANFASTARFTVGSIDEGTYQNFLGDVAQLAMADAGGSVIFRLDPNNWTTGSTWTTSTGHTMTLAGSATVAVVT
jgi:hypothetical protein